MKFSVSLKNNYTFRRLYAKGTSGATSRMVLYCRKNRKRINCLGITVSKKIGKAVCRNRIRRRLKEIYRLHEGELQSGMDIVIVARSRSRYSTYQELEVDFLYLAEKLGLKR